MDHMITWGYMKNILASLIAVFVGVFTIAFAAVMGIFLTIGALIMRPFIKRKMAKMQQEASRNAYSASNDDRYTIDGEYEDITPRHP